MFYCTMLYALEPYACVKSLVFTPLPLVFPMHNEGDP